MTGTHVISMRAIAADLRGGRWRDEMRTSWAIALLYRVPSLPLVWLAVRVGLGPTTVTLAALALALTMPLQALVLAPGYAGLTLAFSGVLFQILDCADGTLARVTGQASRRGADLDFLTDMAQWALLYLAIGILADRTLGGGWGWTAVAAGAAWLRLFARLVRDTLTDDRLQSHTRPVHLRELPVIFVTGLSGLIPFLALAGSALWLSVWFLLVYAMLDLGDALLAARRPSDP